MSQYGPPDSRCISRRRMLAATIGTIAALGLGNRGAGPPAVEAALLDQCYWQTYQTICSSGRLLAYRCEICCAGGSCETVQCGWHDIGPC